MDIYEFIRSKAIREHCKNIGREFTPPESAYLIWQSDHLPEKKRAAWCELMETTPDCKIPGHRSLHEFLRKYMELMEQSKEKNHRLREEMHRKDKDALYYFDTYGCGYQSNEGPFYRFYGDCLLAAMASPEKGDDIFYLHKIQLEKKQDSCELRLKRHIIEEVMPNGEFAGVTDMLAREPNEYIPDFNMLRFEVPVPFKKGDIIYHPDVKDLSWRDEGRPMVFDSVCPVGLPADFKDELTDVVVKVYCEDVNEQIIPMSIYNYLDLEYYPEEEKFLFEEKILPVISLYLKGKLSITGLLKAHSILVLKEAARSIFDNWEFDCDAAERKELDSVELGMGLD